MFRIKLYWTKAHIGVSGNERADELAKGACHKDYIDYYFDPTKSDIKKRLNKLYLSCWQERWNTSGIGIWFQKLVSYNLFFDFYLNQVVTKPVFQNLRFGKDENCLCNANIGTLEHIINECSLWNDIRMMYFESATTVTLIKGLLMNKQSTTGIRLIIQSYLEATMP